jgi:AraC family transcriptional regulator, regulatory protein of adaptative response / DNA-3-methyladenine glycosylase II
LREGRARGGLAFHTFKYSRVIIRKNNWNDRNVGHWELCQCPKMANLGIASDNANPLLLLSMMRTDLYAAILARDYRFDGKFFVAVKSTGIYCRPTCPARPKPQNVEFFPDAISAEKAGYRPCLRCRPESAPLSAAWFGKKAVVQRALKLIARNEFHQSREAEFAARLGMSARHLRRLFEQEIGQTPKQISDNNRLNFARKLIVETDLAVTSVARTAGFHSLRRFNAAFQNRFRRTPSQLRKARFKVGSNGGIDLKLSFRPPYDWASILRFFQTHPIAEVESVGRDFFERVFRIASTVGYFRVQPIPGLPQLNLRVITDDPTVLFEIVSRVRRMFDLDLDPMLIESRFTAVPLLSELYERFPGLRLPGGWDAFETAVASILGQLVSAKQRTQLVGQLIHAYGEPVVHPLSGDEVRLFPRPEVLADCDLIEVKTTLARKEAIREFSRRVASGAISLSEAQDPTAFRRALLTTKGLGPWSSEYISLRAIGDTDAFPRTDLILKRVLALHPGLDLERIKPWRAYAAMYLWKGFAQTLVSKEGRKQYAAVLQGNGIASRQPDAGRKRQGLGRRPLGTRTPKPRESRPTEARFAAPYSAGD